MHGKLHPNFPTEGQYAPTLDEQEVSAYVDMFDDDEGKKLPKSTFDYDSRKDNSGLKFHLTRYHNDL